MKSVRRIWRVILDVFFPPVCVNCGKHAGDESLHNIICRPCFDSISINSIWLPLSPKTVIAAAGRYNDKPIRELVHSLKYGGLEKSAVILGDIMAEYVRKTGLMSLIDPQNAVIVPIPLHPERKKKRGFNQSELIAQELGKTFGIKVVNALERVKNTSPQIEMKNNKEREQNLKESFSLNISNISNIEQIVLVDDVYTSGATIKEAIKTLNKFKPKKTIVLVAAKAGY